MRTRRSRRGVAWVLVAGWAIAGGVADPLGAEPPNPPATGTHMADPVEFGVEPVATASAATNATAAASAVQICGGAGFCVTVLDVSATIPFTGIGIRVYCDLCECTWVEDGFLWRSSWWDCGSRALGVRA
ncbi:hypothetical protein [Candidatus Palauibacter sp.]|uniref:hypothetical protein n=1 Tax=Candidatus Palauibacter sp. TaxID=3101350 RepID=UPI003AF29759